MGKVSDVIAPHGCCAGYEPNYDKLHDTRKSSESSDMTNIEKNREKVGIPCNTCNVKMAASPFVTINSTAAA